MSLSADAPGRNVAYFDSERLLRNVTHFVDIVIPRRPRRDVFKLAR